MIFVPTILFTALVFFCITGPFTTFWLPYFNYLVFVNFALIYVVITGLYYIILQPVAGVRLIKKFCRPFKKFIYSLLNYLGHIFPYYFGYVVLCQRLGHKFWHECILRCSWHPHFSLGCPIHRSWGFRR